ncbi:hypothetical protein AvCA_03920 [Azotobacter vinelandii CA]|uniref:Uncharacterized protein n=2 Tax=Azotobacter vinelandii TaxID=354 RepID=C1DIF3_AZOVD|nr:hypothetical protein Avin_03920 [Azotobacter vinelandii DJ]AGK15622.1 hypothetical protein AvCA_03920 [Azotobacter vinelandii CA]AGK19262.1 hypothetical protein AvCA6_03920 [Azotobacter vinelandii CA6]
MEARGQWPVSYSGGYTMEQTFFATQKRMRRDIRERHNAPDGLPRSGASGRPGRCLWEIETCPALIRMCSRTACRPVWRPHGTSARG